MNNTWSTPTRIMVISTIILGGIWLMVKASAMFESLLIAALLAYLLYPLVKWLERRTRLNHNLATVVVFLVFVLLVASIPAAAGTLAVSQFDRVSAELTTALMALRERASQSFLIFGIQINPQTLVANTEQALSNALASLPGGSLNVLSSLTKNMLWVLLILITMFYLLRDGPQWKSVLLNYVPLAYKAEIDRLIDEIDAVWRLFLKVQLLIFFVLAVLMILGTTGIIWLFRAGLLAFSPLGFILLMVLLYTAVQQVDNLWLRPWLMGESLKLHPALVFIGLTGALAVSGLLGALLIVPGIATAKLVGGYIYRKLSDQSPWEVEDESSPQALRYNYADPGRLKSAGEGELLEEPQPRYDETVENPGT
jgi:predicted PurR-regulated permease PerM